MDLQSLKVSLWIFLSFCKKSKFFVVENSRLKKRKIRLENLVCHQLNIRNPIDFELFFVRTSFLQSENGDRLQRRNAGLKKNLSLAPFWLNWEIGIHQMFSTERKCKCFYMHHQRSFSIRGSKDKHCSHTYEKYLQMWRTKH